MAKKLAFDKVLFTTVLLLVVLGLLMVYSASAVVAGGGATTGGKGGTVDITNRADAVIRTEGEYAIGVFGQSVGGGGGDSGAAGGIVSLGSTAGTGNDAAKVTIVNEAGSQITTFGTSAYAVFGQSVGGGGGNSAATGGAVTMGGTGGTGGNGGDIAVTSGARIETSGNYAHGLFGQSVGGGGGAASGGGGIVDLGRQGGTGGERRSRRAAG